MEEPFPWARPAEIDSGVWTEWAGGEEERMTEERKEGAPRRWISLRGRILLLLMALVVVNLAGASLTLWFTAHSQNVQAKQINLNLASLVAAQGLESSLVMQKGYVTYFFLNGDTEWLKALTEHHRHFEAYLQQARRSDSTAEGGEILSEIESRYIRYVYSRDQVVELYMEGLREEGAERHWQVRDQFTEIYNLAEAYKRLHEKSIFRIQQEFMGKARFLLVMAFLAVPITAGLGLVLAYVFLRQILHPIRRLTFEAEHGLPAVRIGDEIKTLGQRVHSLLDDVDQAQLELVQSREQLMQSEKLALVGKMAAGVAHSVRNPLTSVKMRLYSLERSLDLSAEHKEDFEVIAEEIRHIDTIVGNFLEFSRAPKLKKQMVSLSRVVDNTIALIHHRLESYGMELAVHRDGDLPECLVDPEQVKEVLMNLIFNACEAIADGGRIDISEEVRNIGPKTREIVLTIADDGPGIPESIRDRVFEPFFSAKEEGSGLGLSIARRIVEEHGGRIEFKSISGQGTDFILKFPCKGA